jgi:TRAP-type transport system periplasmic protein
MMHAILAAVVALWAALAAHAGAQTLTGRVAVIYQDGQPTVQMWRRIAERVRTQTNGGVDLTVVPGSQLGGEREVAEGMRLGSIQAADNTLASLTSWVPQGALFDMPFVFRDLDHIIRVMGGPVGERFKRLYAAQGFQVLGYICYGARSLVSRDPIAGPGDVQGRPMRVIQSPLHIALWRSLGANPTAIPIPETYNALSTGVVTFMDMTKDGFEALRLYEVAPHFIETGHIWAVGAVIVSNRFWQRLDADQQRIMQDSANDAIVFFNQLQARIQDEALQRAVARGARVARPDPAPWRAAMRPVWQAQAANVGGMDAIMEIVNTR